MVKGKKTKPITLVHYTSQKGGKNKALATEIVKPGSPSARFLRKMEANRLAQPCNKVIDNRNRTKELCYAYEHNKITHYLDADDIELFEELVHRNKGIYSEAIYRALTTGLPKRTVQVATTAAEIENIQNSPPPNKESSAASSNMKNDKSTAIPHPQDIKIVPFGYHLHQHEIRMNYVSNITVLVQRTDDRENVNIEYHAKTIDISISGIRIKSKNELPIDRDDVVKILFDDLSKRTTIAGEMITYRVIDFYDDDDFVYRLERIYESDNDNFSHALSSFIQTHKRRYKIDLEDFKSAVLSQVYEKIYAQSTLQIPLFFIRNSGTPLLKYTLINKALDSLISHEENIFIPQSSYLSFLTQKIPLEKIYLSLISIYNKSTLNTPKIVIIYAFTDINDEHFIAFDTGKERSKKLTQFINEAQKHHTFKVWELKLRPATIPKIDQSLDIDSLSNTESESLFNEIEDIFLTGLLSLIYDQSSSPDGNSKTHKYKANTNNKNFMNYYHLKEPDDFNVEQIKTADKIHRSENRYQLTTAVSINYEGKKIPGHSIDFSPNGIKVKLDYELDAEIRDEIDISFTSLQDKFPKEHLLNQHYRLTYLSDDKKSACFNRDHRFILHEASLFFRKIIESNSHKLTICSSDHLMMIRSHLFERLLTHNLCSTPVFITHKNKNTGIDSIAHDEFPSSFLQFFKSDDHISLQSIFSGSVWNSIKELLLETSKHSNIQPCLIVALEKKSSGKIKPLLCTNINPLNYSENHDLFTTLSKESHFIMKITFNPVVPYQENEISDEIHEIRLNSKIDSDNFLKRIRSIKYIAEITDMTNYYIHQVQPSDNKKDH